MHLYELDGVPIFIPTLYGDIRLTVQGSQTEVEWENLSPSERLAMDALGKKYDVDTSTQVGKVTIAKATTKVESFLARSMKRGRKLLTAVVFKNGRIEEVHRSEDGEVKPSGHPYRGKPDASAVKAASDALAVRAAATVAAPAMSCPVPEFVRAQVRATRVLREFLSPVQLADFERAQQFVVVGADSGHRYILTSRQAANDVLAKVGGRSVFDCTRGHAVCVHDWTVPAAEELLELALFLQMPGREEHVSVIPFEPLLGGVHR